jgi:hypothetical protein
VANFVDDSFKPVRMVVTGVGGGLDHGRLEKLAQKLIFFFLNAKNSQRKINKIIFSYKIFSF